MAFTPVVLHKDGKDDRIARTPVELVQLQYEGYVVVLELSDDEPAPAPQPVNTESLWGRVSHATPAPDTDPDPQ